jgi:catechol 2,3-dioxygenase-like lactoylglutathione lyase family enzyme
MLYTIEHVSIRCRALETSIEFFRRMFDAEVMLRRAPGEGRRIVFLRIGKSMVELMEMDSASEPVDPLTHFGVHHIGIKVEDFESAYRDLKAKGANFIGEPFEPTPGIRLAFWSLME